MRRTPTQTYIAVLLGPSADYDEGRQLARMRDMLRYDHAFPAFEDWTFAVGPWTYAILRAAGFTYRRWESFGLRVVGVTLPENSSRPVIVEALQAEMRLAGFHTAGLIMTHAGGNDGR